MPRVSPDVTCVSSADFLNRNSTVELKVRYDIIDKNIVRETVTTQSGDPVDKIIFHRVSAP